jgi:hypothetical protein
MNEPNVPHTTITCNSIRQSYCPPPENPLRAAQLHTAAQRIDLRRLRRDLFGSHKIATVDRLLDVNAAVARSLEWLNGKAEVPRDDFTELEQLATTSVAMPDPVGAVAQ